MIQVCIPYAPNQALGTACNAIMQRAEDWVLFLDHDVLLLNPNWYMMCEKAINEVVHKAGIITCMTNRIGCPIQRETVEDTDNLAYHWGIAKSLYNKHGSTVKDITVETRPLSGFFMLTHRKAWEQVGGFCEKFLGMDTQYFGKLRDAGYRFYLLPGLYCYHAYKRFWKTGDFALGAQ